MNGDAPPETLEVNVPVCPTSNVAEEGEMLTPGAEETVIVAVLDFAR
jgi:hypothetical protein